MLKPQSYVWSFMFQECKRRQRSSECRRRRPWSPPLAMTRTHGTQSSSASCRLLAKASQPAKLKLHLLWLTQPIPRTLRATNGAWELQSSPGRTATLHGSTSCVADRSRGWPRAAADDNQLTRASSSLLWAAAALRTGSASWASPGGPGPGFQERSRAVS